MLRYSVFALPVLLFAGASEPAQAACLREGTTVTCNDQDANGYNSPSTAGISLTVNPGATLYNVDNGELFGDCDELAAPSIALGDDSVVTNRGTVTSQGACGFAIALSDRGAVINRGRIVTYGSLGVGILAGDDLNVSNAGGISTQGQAGYGVFAGDRTRIATDAGSFILTAGAGASGITLHDAGAVDNKGRIETMDDAADGINAGAGATLRNSGTIATHGAQAAGVRAAGGSVAIVNSGEISALFAGQTNAPSHALGIAATADLINVTNTGTIAGSYAAAQLAGARFATLTNTGVMTAAGERRNDGSHAAGGAVILADAGVVTIVNSGQVTALNGLAAIRTSGGSVNLTNSGAITGDVLFGDGDDQFKFDGGTLQGTFDAGAGADTLVLTGNGDLSAPVLNVENLSKSGPGTWTIRRAVSFAKQANVLDGVLVVGQDGTVTTPALNIITSGTLAGLGAVAGIVDNAGTVAPGAGAAAPARLSVLGAYIQRADGTLALRVNNDGTNDSLMIGGTATLGGALRITYDPAVVRGHFTGARTARIIFAADRGLAVQGDFARVVTNAAFIDTRVSTSANGVDLTFSRLSYGAAASDPNQRAAGAMLDRTAGVPALAGVIAALDAGTPESATGILAAITPETIPAVQNLGLFTLQSLREAAPSADDRRFLAWGNFLNRHGSAASSPYSGFRYDLTGVAAGFSLKASDSLHVGALLARTGGDAQFTAAKGDLDGSFAGVSLGYDGDSFTATAGAIYGAAHPETRRTQVLLGNTTALTARGSADMWSVYGALETRFDFGPVSITPRAGLARESISLGRFDENASLAAPLSADVQASDARSLRAELGVRGEAAVGGVRPYLGLQASKELGDGRRAAVVRISGVPGSDFTVIGPRPRGFALAMDGGIAIDLAPGLAAHAGGRFTANDVFAGRAVNAGLTYRW